MPHALMENLDWNRVRDESLSLVQDLIRIDTTNPPGGEMVACRYLEKVFQREGIPCVVYEPSPGRGNIVARLGSSAAAAPVLLSAHLDVVPAEERFWTHSPFSAEIHEGYLWGRGAIDMKNMAAMEVMCLLAAHRGGVKLKRDLIFAGVSDEEAGCAEGSLWLAERYPELIRGEYAISEIGGFTLTLGKARYYPVQVAEKGMCWLTIRAEGTPGHGSIPNPDNALAKIGQAASRLGTRMPPLKKTEVVAEYLRGLASLQPGMRRLVMKQLLNPMFSDLILDNLVKDPTLRNAFRAALRNTANPTILRGGYKVNVVPGEAELQVDGRMLPGQTHEDLIAEIIDIIGPGYHIAVDRTLPAVAGSFDDPLTDLIQASIQRHDPGALALPYLAPGFTDAKAYAPLGMKCFGFSPVKMGPDDSFARWFHGHDERIPVEGFHFGVKSLMEVVLDLAG